jgi:hypothetical protein
MTGDDGVALCADAAAQWHAAWLTALDVPWERTERVWRALVPPHFIYWSAITLVPDAGVEDLRAQQGTVCDAWSGIDLAPFDFAVWAREPWFVRPAGPLRAAEPPPGLEVVRVSTPADVEEFERVSVHGFSGEARRYDTGSIHPPPILRDPRMTMLTGRFEGEAVAVAMRYRTDRAVGIYGVTTLTSARGRGYATALTSALVDPGLPATLAPSEMAESMYRRLGFDAVGELTMWQRR